LNTNPQPEIIAYAAKTILSNLVDLQKSIKGVNRRRNVEDIHDLRVSSRRIREALDIFMPFLPAKKSKNWEKIIRSLTKTFGNARDLDVQIEFVQSFFLENNDAITRPGGRRLLLRLHQKRQRIQKELQATLKELAKSNSIEGMNSSLKTMLDNFSSENFESSALYHLAFNAIHKRLDEFLFFEIYIPYPDRVKELHLMRIAAKRLRYAMEVFSPLYVGKLDSILEVIRCAQSSLGEIRDCDIWLTYIPEFVQKEKDIITRFYGNTRPYNRIFPGLQSLQSNRKQQREALYKGFTEDWKKWHQEEIWVQLRQIIFEPTLSMPKNELIDVNPAVIEPGNIQPGELNSPNLNNNESSKNGSPS